jgi:hypothetical protein
MMTDPIRFTINDSVNFPYILHDCSVPDMRALFAQIDASFSINDDKTAHDLIVPVAEWTERYRAAHYIARMSRIFVADVDELEPAAAEALWAELKGTSCIIHTSHSHLTPRKHELGCYRLIFELTDEYAPDEWPMVWRAMQELCQGKIDPCTAEPPSRGYYLPSAPTSHSQSAARWLNEGEPLCTDELIAFGQDLGAVSRSWVAPVRKVRDGVAPNRTAILQQASRWVNSRYQRTQNSGAIAKAILTGQQSIPVGEGKRNQALYDLATIIGRTWPNASSDDIAKVFIEATPGWDLVSPDSKYDLEELSGMIARCQDYAEAWAQEQADAKAEQLTQGQRTTTITEEEIAHLAEVYGPQWWQHACAILNKDVYFLRPNGTYDPSPVQIGNILPAARNRLAVFGRHVEDNFEIEGKNGPHLQKKNSAQFVYDYGTVIDAVVYDLTRPQGGWDPLRRTILMQVGEARVEPAEHPEIQRWLECCGDFLIDMVSQMPHHDLMLPALVMIGKGGTGKTLLANGIAQIYAHGPAPAEAAFHEFNAKTLCACPIVLMDEKAAPQYRKEGTTFLRRFLTERVRELNEKYRTRVELHGFLRLIVAANSVDVLETNEDMGPDDRDAFAERLVYIDMNAGAEELGKHPQPEIQREWLDKRHLAQHVLWLSEHWKVRNPGRRFAVRQEEGALRAALSSHTGTARDVLHWLLSFLAEPGVVVAKHAPIEVTRGELRVNGKAVFREWSAYLADYRKPSPNMIGKAIASLAVGKKRQKLHLKRGRVDAYVIDLEQLKAANELHGLVADLDRALQQVEAMCRQYER